MLCDEWINFHLADQGWEENSTKNHDMVSVGKNDCGKWDSNAANHTNSSSGRRRRAMQGITRHCKASKRRIKYSHVIGIQVIRAEEYEAREQKVPATF